MANDNELPWRCFHCDEVFTDWIQARNHFGYTPEDGAPACKTTRSHDAEVYHLKRQVEILQRQISEEDTPKDKEIGRLKSEHHRALIREEEKGYARGLEDAKKYPEELGLCRA